MNWTSNDIERYKDRIVKPGSKFSVIDDTLLKKVQEERKHEESDLQIACIKAFGLVHARYAKRLRSIPNEREDKNIPKFIKMGMMPGSLDLELLVKRWPYGSLQIEIKTDKGGLRPNQIAFIKEMQADYKCVVVRSVEQFLREVKEYLKG